MSRYLEEPIMLLIQMISFFLVCNLFVVILQLDGGFNDINRVEVLIANIDVFAVFMATSFPIDKDLLYTLISVLAIISFFYLYFHITFFLHKLSTRLLSHVGVVAQIS